MRAYQIIAIIIFFAFNCAKGSEFYEQYIFTINAHFQERPNNSLQTGFRLKGKIGIVTALHGVLGANSVGAYNEIHQRFSNLQIDAVDIAHDLALLSSPTVVKLGAIGLGVPVNNLLKPRQRLDGWGHPQGINLRATPVYVNKVPTKNLVTLIPSELQDTFQTRKSPASDITIIDLDAPLVPGFSGGPLLNDAHEIVGVIDGGLQKESQICWAIPIDQIHWRNLDESKTELERLKQMPTDKLFNFAPVSNKQPASSSLPLNGGPNSLGACVLRAISVAGNNFVPLKTGVYEAIGTGDYVWSSNLLPDGALTSEVWNGPEESDNYWTCDIYVSGNKQATLDRFSPYENELRKILDNGWIVRAYTNNDGFPAIYFKNDLGRQVTLTITYRKNAYRLHVRVQKAE